MKEHKYAELAHRLHTEIQSGMYLAGQQSPSESELAATTGYSHQAVHQAMDVLEQEGLTYRVQGSDTYVRGAPAHQQPAWNIAAVTIYIGEYISPATLHGVDHILVKNGYTLMLNATYNRVNNERCILTELLQKPVDGMIVEGAKIALLNPNIDLYERSTEMGTPVVFINGFYPNLEKPVYVAADDRAGGFATCVALVEEGHRWIAGIFRSDDIQGHRRYAGYAEALCRANLSAGDDRAMWYAIGNRDSLLDTCTLSVLSTCTGVICYNDEVALHILEVLGKTSVAVPQQMELVSFNHNTLAQLFPTPFLSLSNPKETLGRLTAKRLLHILGGRAEQSVLLPWNIE